MEVQGVSIIFVTGCRFAVNTSSLTKCVSLSNRKCKIQHTFINLHPNKYSQEFHYYPFTVANVLDVVIPSMTYLIKNMFQKKTEDLN